MGAKCPVGDIATQFLASNQEIRWHCAELMRGEVDMVLMGHIMATLSNNLETKDEKFQHTPTQRKLSSMAFFHGGHQVYGKTFRKLHGIGMYKCRLDFILDLQSPFHFEVWE